MRRAKDMRRVADPFGPGRGRRGFFVGMFAALAAAAALTAGLGLMLRTEPDAPLADLTDATVVAEIADGPRARSPELKAALSRTRAQPEDAEAARQAARLLIDEGRAAADSRLVGAALGVLRPFLEAPDAGTLHLAASARQYQHDFDGATTLLDRALTLDPRHVPALLMRAAIRTVRGDFDAAVEDCRRISALRRARLGLLCESAALTLTETAPMVYARLDALTSARAFDADGLRAYALGLMGEVAGLDGRDALARAHLGEALALAPDDLRLRLMLADLLLAADEPGPARDLLAPAPDADGVLIRRILALRALGEPAEAEAIAAPMARRLRRAIDLGLAAHSREQAEFFLRVDPQPALALDRAEANWALQHEVEDLRLLIEAAEAAGAPDRAAPALRWMAEAGVVVPTLRIPANMRRGDAP